MTFRVFLSMLMLIAANGASTANAGSLLADAAGDWKGSGWYRKNSADQKRATKCALKLAYSQSKNTLSISGKCAGGGRSAKVSGYLVEKSERDYSGRWRAIDMTGRRSGNTIHFSWRAKSESSQEIELYSAKWIFSSKGIVITSHIIAGRGTKLSSLFLQR